MCLSNTPQNAQALQGAQMGVSALSGFASAYYAYQNQSVANQIAQIQAGYQDKMWQYKQALFNFQTKQSSALMAATNAQIDAQVKIFNNNAKYYKYEGDYAKQAAEEEALKHKAEVRRFLGTQRAQQSASGIVVDSGSFLDLELDTLELGKLDELAILHEGDKAAWQAEIAADNELAKASLAESGKITSALQLGLPGMDFSLDLSSIYSPSPYLAAIPALFGTMANLTSNLTSYNKTWGKTNTKTSTPAINPFYTNRQNFTLNESFR